jgi:transcriptional regulator with XRE-family HTH domain
MRKYKPIDPSVAASFGNELKRIREQRRTTLVEAAAKTGIHFGQLSRFEAGDYKVISANLQKYAKFMRIPTPDADETLVARFERCVARSPRHHAACELVIEALEKLE